MSDLTIEDVLCSLERRSDYLERELEVCAETVSGLKQQILAVESQRDAFKEENDMLHSMLKEVQRDQTNIRPLVERVQNDVRIALEGIRANRSGFIRLEELKLRLEELLDLKLDQRIGEDTSNAKMGENKSKDLIRVLLVHGFGQNGKIISSRTGALKRVFKEREIIAPDAPFLLPREDGLTETFGWWTRDPNLEPITSSSKARIGIDVSLQHLEDICKGGVDVICGFSQGGTITAMLLWRMYHSNPSLLPKCCIIWAPYLPVQDDGDDALSDLVSDADSSLEISPCPILFVHGSSDEAVSTECSKRLQRLLGGSLLIHEGGHFIPLSKSFRDAYAGLFIINEISQD